MPNDSIEELVYELICKKSSTTTSEICKTLKLKELQVSQAVKSLENAGLVKFGSDKLHPVKFRQLIPK